MARGFKRVPALEKCFNLLEILSKNNKNFGISEIAKVLDYHKGTVYNLVYTLAELGILEQTTDNKFRLGTQLYALGKAAGGRSELIQTVHPYLEEIHLKLNLSAYLGILIRDRVVTLDKVDSPVHLKVSSEIGMSTPILAGAVGRIILAKMSDEQVEIVLSRHELKKFTPFSYVNKEQFRQAIGKAREDGYAFSDQEYIEGIRALAVPLNNYKVNVMTAIYVLGLNSQIRDEDIEPYAALLMKTAELIDDRLSLT